jgi:hypothetical protein
MQDAIEAFLRGDLSGGTFVLRYRIGSGFTGLTTLEVRGDGEYEAVSTVTEGRRKLRFTGRISRARLERLVQAIAEARVWETPADSGIPKLDEPVPAIAVEADGEKQEVAVPASQLEEVPAFARAQEVLLEFAREVSDGAVLERGR